MFKSIINPLKRAREAEPEQKPVKISKVVPYADLNPDHLLFTEIEGTMVVLISGKDVCYKWSFPKKELINDNMYFAEILHNREHKAMLNFIDLESRQIVYRCEINPLDDNGTEEWIVDHQY